MSAPDLVETEGGFLIGNARRRLALSAASEADVLALRGIIARLIDLSAAAIAALDDERHSVSEIARRVRIALPELEGEA